MSKTRSEILVASRTLGETWSGATAQVTKDRLRDTNTPLYEALEALSRLTGRKNEGMTSA